MLAGRLARPVEELAEAAARLGAGDPRPLGRRYGVADLDQVADGLDTSARRLSSLLAADRELAVDASHQLRTPLTALSMRLEEMIAAADDPEVVREEGSAALTQAERLADVVTQLLSPARRATAASAALTGIDEIVQQQVIEWEPAFRRVRRKLVVIGVRGLQAYVTPGGLAQVLATLLDNALMHGGGTVTRRLRRVRVRSSSRSGTRVRACHRNWCPGSSSGASAAARREPGWAWRWRGRWRRRTGAGGAGQGEARHLRGLPAQASTPDGHPAGPRPRLKPTKPSGEHGGVTLAARGVGGVEDLPRRPVPTPRR